MATTPTNKPIPSEDPRDLKFNAGKIDEEVNGSADYYTDRFSVQRLTNTGRNNQFQERMTQQADDWLEQFNQQETDFQQFLLNSGYQFLGDYEDGPYTITARNQIIRYQNEFWRLNASTTPPYTTTGVNSASWATDVSHLVSVGDANLRQELASQTGGDMVGYKKPFPGAIRRGIGAMLLDWVTPEDYGMVSDAVFDPSTGLVTGTDNTLGLQNMLNDAHKYGLRIVFPRNGRYASKSVYLHYDATLNPEWEGRPGRIEIEGTVTGHATGDVETQGTALFHLPGEAKPFISMIGEFSLANPAGMGGYLKLGRINLVGSAQTTDVLLLQGSQGQIELYDYTVKVQNPNGNGITEATTWESMHRNGLIRGGATTTNPGVWTGIGLNIRSDGTIGQINMKIYENVNVYRMGYGIRIGRRAATQGTFGPLVFIGGQTSLSDEHGIWLDGGVIAFTSIGQQHEGARKNAIRVDNVLEDGTVSSDLPRTIKFLNPYITGSGTIEDGTVDSYAIYVANGDGIELDTPTFNTCGNGIAFDAANVDNLLIRRPTFRTVRSYGVTSGYGIRSFVDGVATKRQYLEHPVFNQTPATQIDDKAREIFGRGAAGGRITFSTNTPTPSIIHGSGSGNESYHILNFNNTTATTITNITGGTPYQRLLVTFNNTNTTIQNNRTNIFLRDGDFVGSSSKMIELFYNGTAWYEIGDPTRALGGSSRPSSQAFPFMMYFDTNIGKPIWRNAANTGWVDAAGNVV